MPRGPTTPGRLLKWFVALLVLVFVWEGLLHWAVTSGSARSLSSDDNQNHNHNQKRSIKKNSAPKNASTVYVITPTHARSTQHPDLTRVAHSLMLDKKAHWIVIEDQAETSPWVETLLESSGLTFTLLHCQGMETIEDAVKLFPKKRRKPKKFSYGPGKGVVQRNCGLKWLESQGIEDGVFYFADDDNTYDYRLFREIRTTKGVSVFPVGHIHSTGVSTPIVKNGRVVGFLDPWQGGRKLQVDMAGFAVNIRLWREKQCPMMGGGKGMLEELFLLNMDITMHDLEPKADHCSQILVWHTHTKDITASNGRIRTKLKKYGSTSTNLNALLKQAFFASGRNTKGQQGMAAAAAEPDEPKGVVLSDRVQSTPAVDT